MVMRATGSGMLGSRRKTNIKMISDGIGRSLATRSPSPMMEKKRNIYYRIKNGGQARHVERG
jgi:hypothetical protein